MHTDEEGPRHKETSEAGNFHASPAMIILFQHKVDEDECTQGGLGRELCFLAWVVVV